MSIKAMQWVMDCSEATLASRLVILAIADNANAEGEDAFPKIETLAAKTRLSVRTVYESIEKLVEAGELRVEKMPGGRRNCYSLPGMNPANERPFEGGILPPKSGNSIQVEGADFAGSRVRSSQVEGADFAGSRVRSSQVEGADFAGAYKEEPSFNRPSTTVPQPQAESAAKTLDEQIRALVDLHPAWDQWHGRMVLPPKVIGPVARAIEADGFELVMAGTRSMAELVGEWPPGNERFRPNPVEFFNDRQYAKDPAVWRRYGNSGGGSGQDAIDRAIAASEG